MRLVTVLLAAVVLPLASCQEAQAGAAQAPGAAAPAARGPVRITGTQARTLLTQGASFIDVRTPEEFADLHLDGARNVPLSDLGGALASLPKDKPVVIYCASGARSATAARMLAAAGYAAYDLGGLDNWRR